MSQWIRDRARWVDAAGAVVCLALSAAVYVGAVRPTWMERAAAERRRVQRSADSASEQRQSLQLRQIQERQHDLRDLRERIPVQLRPVRETNARLAALVDCAKASGLEVSGIAPGTPTPGPRSVVVPITLRGVGAYPAVVRFLTELREKFADTGVRAMAISNSVAESPPPPTFSLDLAWYAASDADAGAPPGVSPK